MMRASAAESLHAFTLSAPARAAGARLHDIEKNVLMGSMHTGLRMAASTLPRLPRSSPNARAARSG